MKFFWCFKIKEDLNWEGLQRRSQLNWRSERRWFENVNLSDVSFSSHIVSFNFFIRFKSFINLCSPIINSFILSSSSSIFFINFIFSISQLFQSSFSFNFSFLTNLKKSSFVDDVTSDDVTYPIALVEEIQLIFGSW